MTDLYDMLSARELKVFLASCKLKGADLLAAPSYEDEQESLAEAGWLERVYNNEGDLLGYSLSKAAVAANEGMSVMERAQGAVN